MTPNLDCNQPAFYACAFERMKTGVQYYARAKIVLKLRNASIKSLYCLISGENASSFFKRRRDRLKRGGAKIDEYFDEKHIYSPGVYSFSEQEDSSQNGYKYREHT